MEVRPSSPPLRVPHSGDQRHVHEHDRYDYTAPPVLHECSRRHSTTPRTRVRVVGPSSPLQMVTCTYVHFATTPTNTRSHTTVSSYSLLRHRDPTPIRPHVDVPGTTTSRDYQSTPGGRVFDITAGVLRGTDP